ncbi:uncharacterized protein LOC134827245 [Culicoides brevitarsis]|uniref:uncharacterized protein LOC134827245 n=1 Tax=Culicoides brevitarsis TaxID=469753 RepID=UPI00307C1D77
MQMQDQIYLILIVCGSFTFIFFISILVICCLMCYFKKEIRDLQRVNRERYAYNNPTIQPGEELSDRGFRMIHSPMRLERQNDGRYGSSDESQMTRRSQNNPSTYHSRNGVDSRLDSRRDFREYQRAVKNEKPRTKKSLERRTTDSVAIVSEY